MRHALTLLDPFPAGGTIPLAAKNLNRDSVGYERK